jgi:hypothetical protein
MAAPTYVASGTGEAATASPATPSKTGVTVGNCIICQMLQDGVTASGSTMSGSTTGVAALDGTANSMTKINPAAGSPVGNPTTAGMHVWIGRATATTVNCNITTTADDTYAQVHEFTNVNTGSTIAAVIENATAGSFVIGRGTGTSVTDVAVVTLGVDRLALNLVFIDDDATGIAAFAGASGGTWAMPASFESATGTDGTVALMTAAMASAGTIDGGSDTITTDNWGVTGFALIGTTVPATFIQLRDPWPAMQAVNRSNVY